MDPAIRHRIAQISADFYRFHAHSFADTRHGAWDSWPRVWAEVQTLVTPSNVLDLGCGNGRFATFLRSRGVEDPAYTGVDGEEALISKARQRHPNERFEVATIEHFLESSAKFDVVVCFGVFHHLPGRQYRNETLNRFTQVLRGGGVVVISAWQPKLLKNFANMVCVNHNIAGLEHNDFLLGWQGDFSHLRYCHHFDDSEVDELGAQCQLEPITQFQGTGNDQTNRYLILQKPLGA